MPVPRSLYFLVEDTSIRIPDVIKKGSVDIPYDDDWDSGTISGNLRRVDIPKKIGIRQALKFGAYQIEKALGALGRRIEIAEPDFEDFLKKLKVTTGFNLKFWEIDYDENWTRSYSANKEKVQFYSEMKDTFDRAEREAQWAGIGVSLATNPGIRVFLYRYPTASIMPYHNPDEEKYNQFRKQFEDFLTRTI